MSSTIYSQLSSQSNPPGTQVLPGHSSPQNLLAASSCLTVRSNYSQWSIQGQTWFCPQEIYLTFPIIIPLFALIHLHWPPTASDHSCCLKTFTFIQEKVPGRGKSRTWSLHSYFVFLSKDLIERLSFTTLNRRVSPCQHLYLPLLLYLALLFSIPSTTNWYASLLCFPLPY